MRAKLRLLLSVWHLWRRYPEFRFGQLIVNVLGADPFYVEDKEATNLFDTFESRLEDPDGE